MCHHSKKVGIHLLIEQILQNTFYKQPLTETTKSLQIFADNCYFITCLGNAVQLFVQMVPTVCQEVEKDLLCSLKKKSQNVTFIFSPQRSIGVKIIGSLADTSTTQVLHLVQ